MNPMRSAIVAVKALVAFCSQTFDSLPKCYGNRPFSTMIPSDMSYVLLDVHIDLDSSQQLWHTSHPIFSAQLAPRLQIIHVRKQP